MSMCRYGFTVTDGHRYVDCCQYVYMYKVHLLSLREVFFSHICTYIYIYMYIYIYTLHSAVYIYIYVCIIG